MQSQTLLLLLLVVAVSAFELQTLRVVQRYPHDPLAFTEGLCFAPRSSASDGRTPPLLESTGIWGASTLRSVELQTGRVLQQLPPLSDDQFAEGIAVTPEMDVLQLTWQNRTAYSFPLAALDPTLSPSSRAEQRNSSSISSSSSSSSEAFAYPPFIAEGWGLCSSPLSSSLLHMSDGSALLHTFAAANFSYLASTVVHLPSAAAAASSSAVSAVNELEAVRGEVWANVFGRRCILRIDPWTGGVRGVLLAGSELYSSQHAAVEVMNGIAFDGQRVVVTGKLWPWMYEVEAAQRVLTDEQRAEEAGLTAAELFELRCPLATWVADDERYEQEVLARVRSVVQREQTDDAEL